MSKLLTGKVWLVNQHLSAGGYNKGLIIGYELFNPRLYVVSESDFFSGFEPYRYKVAYVNLGDGKPYVEWFGVKEVSKTKPED
jgi:hypothetical protein